MEFDFAVIADHARFLASGVGVTLLLAALSGATTPAPKVMKEAVQTKAPVVTEPHPSSLRRPPIRPQAEEEPTPISAVSTATVNKSIWPNVLAAVKAKHNTLYSIVRATEPQFTEPGTIQLVCAYAFHQKRLNEKRNKQVLGEIIKDVCGEDVRIACIVGDPQIPQFDGPPPLPPADEQIFTISAQTGVAPRGAIPASRAAAGEHEEGADRLTEPQTSTSGVTGPHPNNEDRQDQPKQADPTVAAISNIFGGAELLES